MAQETPRRRNSLRAGGYNYAWAGAYFVTICVADRLPRFGQIIDGQMVLNDAGMMIADAWRRLPERFPFIKMDAFVVMPNHLHGIVVIDSDIGEFDPLEEPNQSRANTRFAPTGGEGFRPRGTAEGSLSRVIQGFKSLTTGMYIKGVKERGWEPYDEKLWQRSFYDHIIRDDRDLDRIRTYIDANPAKWSEDTEYVLPSSGRTSCSPGYEFDHQHRKKRPMSTNGHAQQVVQKLWNYCNVLRDDGLSYGDYVEQLTYLLFLKMAHERTQPPWNEPSRIPAGYDWPSLMAQDGDALENYYRHTLETLGTQPGMLGIIFRKAQNKIQDPAMLRRLIVDLIDTEQWTMMSADVKGDAYEGLLERNAQDIKGGAGQYFTPRPLIDAMVDCIDPKPGETIIDPACGTGGFLLAAHDHIVEKNPYLDPDQRRHLDLEALHGVEIVDGVTRLCAMNLMLHGIGSTSDDTTPPVTTDDSLRSTPSERYDIVLTNPPFGKKSSITIIGQDGQQVREQLIYEREDFWATTSNKQLNFVQHIKSLLKVNGRAAVVVPDNVLFEGGAGETVRRRLLQECDVHTLLRLPTGIFYAQGVKANVIFFERKPGREQAWTRKLWIYDLRTNKHFTLKVNPLTRADLDDFVACYNPENRHERTPTWSEENPDGRWRCYDYEDLIARDKVNLDIFWLRDESLEDSANLPEPDVLAGEIIEDLRAALEEFELIQEDLSDEPAELVVGDD